LASIAEQLTGAGLLSTSHHRPKQSHRTESAHLTVRRLDFGFADMEANKKDRLSFDRYQSAPVGLKTREDKALTITGITRFLTTIYIRTRSSGRRESL
jgi:hypothetical protein